MSVVYCSLVLFLTKLVQLFLLHHRLGELMPAERLEITFKIDPSTIEHEENTRYLTLTPHGDKWSERLARIENEGYLDDLIIEFEEE